MRKTHIVTIGLITSLGFSLAIIKDLVLDNGVEAVYRIEEGQTGNIVPGEFIVKYKQGKSPGELRELTALRGERAQSSLGKIINQLENIRLQAKGEDLPEELLDKLARVEGELEVLRRQTLFGRINLVETREALAPGFFIARYGRLGTVEYVEPNRIFKVHEAPSDTFYPEMWSLHKDQQGLDMEGAWELSKGSANVTVAVVDTGIDFTHEDFQGRNILPGRDFATCDFALGEVDGEPFCLIEKSCSKLDQGYCDDDPTDDLGHGTHVAGTIGAVTNNNRGVAGINWDVTILPVKSANFMGQLLTSWIVQGTTYAADQGADVINMSFGVEGVCSQSMQEIIDYARSRGAAVVVAAGNIDVDAGGFDPASCRGVITVGATGPGKGRASYSNFGAVVDIAAPGGDPSEDRNKDGYIDSLDCIRAECILSTYPPQENYRAVAGTSMAAPHVTGIVALLLAVRPGLPPDEVEQILKTTADPLTTDKPIGSFANPQRALGSTRPSPTATLPPSRPTPTIAFPGCPAECPADKLSRRSGNADCDGDIDEADYNIWLGQWQVYSRGEQIPAAERTADFDCRAGDIATQYITLSDYEFWRRAAFGGVGGPTATPTPGGECLTEEVEPNDGSENADNNLPLCKDTTLEGRFAPSDWPFDWYRIQVPQQGKLIADLTDVEPQEKFTLHLQDKDNLTRDIDNAFGEDARIEYLVRAEKYYLVVFNHDRNNSSDYRLRWTLEGVSVTPTPTPTLPPGVTPTATPIPTATSTPNPTSTPTVTSTPAPTATPVPTATPRPTLTPTPAVGFGSAVKLDGTSFQPDYIKVADSESLTLGARLTIEGWVKVTGQPTEPWASYQTIFSKRDDPVTKRLYWLHLDWERRLLYSACRDWDNDCISYSGGQNRGTTSLALNRWYHVALVKDGAHITVYLDGKKEIELDYAHPTENGLVADLLLGAYCVSEGCQYPNSGVSLSLPLHGEIDEVRVSNSVRHSGEFTRPNAPFAPDASTVALWHFDEGSGTTATDASSNGNNGQLMGGARFVTR